MFKIVAITVSAGLLLAGCSDDAKEDGLLGALGRVRATAENRVSVEYGEPAAVRALLDQDKARYQTLRGFGYSAVAQYGGRLDDALGLDLDGFYQAIHVGNPPKQTTILWGEYDVATVDDKLRGLNIDDEAQFGGTRWRSADDNEISFDGPFIDMAPPAQLNNILTTNGSFAYAPAAEGIDWVADPGDDTLADDDVLAPLATCLGDVVAAQLMATGEAVGVRQDSTEVICLEGDQARVSAALKEDLPSTGEPWDSVLPGAEVTQDGALARITVPAQDGEPVGRVLRLILNGDLAGLR